MIHDHIVICASKLETIVKRLAKIVLHHLVFSVSYALPTGVALWPLEFSGFTLNLYVSFE